MSIWTVRPEDRTIHLTFTAPDGTSHPFWIRVKRRLNVGERRRLQTAGWRGVRPGREAEVAVDWEATSFARTQAYLLEWSLTGDDGTRMPITREGIEALDEDVFAVIERALSEHVEAMEQEKKAGSSRSEPSATSA